MHEAVRPQGSVEIEAVSGRHSYHDILNLIRTNEVDTASAEFTMILNKYAPPEVKDRLLKDIAV
jgi:hypothetical protein